MPIWPGSSKSQKNGDRHYDQGGTLLWVGAMNSREPLDSLGELFHSEIKKDIVNSN